MSRSTRSTTIRIVTVALATTGLGVAGAGLAVAAAPQSGFAQAVESVVQGAGVDWSAMPENYTQEQYEAFWGAEYTGDDLLELQKVWSLDETETKARAGQMILDGQELPFAPGTHGAPPLSADAEIAVTEFFSAGYTVDDAQVLGALWSTDILETKARAGQMILDGQTVPVDPSGTPSPSATPAG